MPAAVSFHHVGRYRLVSGGGSKIALHWAWIELLRAAGSRPSGMTLEQ
jgi:hypothetical protein